jgi:nucleoside-diphosphate-sugar epimerase
MLKNKKLLITGLTGNLGGSLASALAEHNDLWGYARYSRKGQQEFWQGKGVTTVVGDFSNKEFEGLPSDFDYVIHCAANCSPESFEQGMQDNPQGTGLLMAHCKKAKGFLHISTIGVYGPNSNSTHRYTETDITGGSVMQSHYEGTKLAAEGAVQAMALHLELPTTVARLGVQYGVYNDGGMLGLFLKLLLAGHPIPVPALQSGIIQPISDDDVASFLEPLLTAASVPPTLTNLAGDETITVIEAMEYFGELAGVKPNFSKEGFEYPTYQLNCDKRRSITGPCQVNIKEGLEKMFHTLAPKIKQELQSDK